MNPEDETPTPMRECPVCFGECTLLAIDSIDEAGRITEKMIDCPTCNGDGEVPETDDADDAAHERRAGK